MRNLAIALGLSLCALPWTAHGKESAAVPVSLTIRESCLIERPAPAVSPKERPDVSCLHHAAAQIRFVSRGLPVDEPSAPDEPSVDYWLVEF
ncbi:MULTISPECIES: hypothetical protein [Dyella]|uniref:Uncharacterized protein n=2 Tax=Dyella TaxID=231454 RepID=A0A4V2NMC4_9GAMM|nr:MULTISPECIES: hypothetical protein [Dyella]TBR39590.1 hypothetical protein EYV96_05140 [Dyella terrae]TCI12827.1 hypothetical protein EZM97_05730 [Dyella soli]